METGATRRSTELYGLRGLRRVGLPIMTAAGPGSIHGAGLGLTMHHGALRPSTMDAGLISITGGGGAPAQSRRAYTMPPRWSLSSAAADLVWVSRLAAGAAV